MRPTRDLRRLRRAALSRLDRLSEYVFDAATTPPNSPRHDQLTALCVVEMYNMWFGFSRSLYISSCLGARDGAGVRLSLARVPRPPTAQDALTHAIRRCKLHRFKAKKGTPPWQRIDEPSWASTTVLLDALDEVGATNYVLVSGALSLPGAAQTISHLPDFRHFYAHRGEGTRLQAVKHAPTYALSSQLAPTALLNSNGMVAGVARPQPLLMDWADDLRAIVGHAI